MTPRYYIGLDPGAHIGLAVWCRDTQRFTLLKTCKRADEVLSLLEPMKGFARIRVEDPNANKPVFWRPGVNMRSMLKIAQNVGANKQMATNLIDALRRAGHDVVTVAPLHTGKRNAAEFMKLTGWRGKSSQHSRDAGMLVVKL